MLIKKRGAPHLDADGWAELAGRRRKYKESPSKSVKKNRAELYTVLYEPASRRNNAKEDANTNIEEHTGMIPEIDKHTLG